MARTILHEDERGYVIAEGNELTIGSKLNDPPKVRVCVPITATGGGGGVFSASRARSFGVCFGDQQDEMGYVRFEQAEDVRGDVGHLRSEVNLFVASGLPGTDVERVFACTWDRFTKWGLSALTSLSVWLGGGGTSRADTMWAPNGLSFTQQQDDGNFVTYSVTRAFDKTANPKAIWSAWTGPIA